MSRLRQFGVNACASAWWMVPPASSIQHSHAPPCLMRFCRRASAHIMCVQCSSVVCVCVCTSSTSRISGSVAVGCFFVYGIAACACGQSGPVACGDGVPPSRDSGLSSSARAREHTRIKGRRVQQRGAHSHAHRFVSVAPPGRGSVYLLMQTPPFIRCRRGNHTSTHQQKTLKLIVHGECARIN